MLRSEGHRNVVRGRGVASHLEIRTERLQECGVTEVAGDPDPFRRALDGFRDRETVGEDHCPRISHRISSSKPGPSWIPI